MSVKSLQDSVNRIIELQDRHDPGVLGERLDKLEETSEFIRRSLGTISHHMQNSNTTALHENLVTMIRSEITSGVQEALLSTVSGTGNSDKPPTFSLQKPELENIVAQDISGLKEDALLNFNGTKEICDPSSSDQPSVSSLDYDVGATWQLFQLLVLARVGAQGLQVHRADAHQVSALGLVELIQVRLVLEEVGIQALLGHLYVGLHVVGEDFDLQVYTFLGEGRFHEFEDLRVRNRRSGDRDGLGMGGKRGNGGESNQ